MILKKPVIHCSMFLNFLAGQSITKSTDIFSIFFCIRSRILNVSEILCKRPKYFKSVSFNPCTPKEILLTPANLKSLILLNSKFVGLDLMLF